MWCRSLCKTVTWLIKTPAKSLMTCLRASSNRSIMDPEWLRIRVLNAHVWDRTTRFKLASKKQEGWKYWRSDYKPESHWEFAFDESDSGDQANIAALISSPRITDEVVTSLKVTESLSSMRVTVMILVTVRYQRSFASFVSKGRYVH